MKSNTLCAALAAGLLAAALFMPAQAADSAAIKVTPAVGKSLAEAQKLMQASPPDLRTAMDKVHEAQAVPGRTPQDDYIITQFAANIAIGLKDYATATADYEAMADSPLIDQDENKVSALSNALLLSSAANHYQKAIHYGELLAATGPLTPKNQGVLAIDYYNLRDYVRAKDMAQKSVDGAKAAGQQPDPNALQVLVNSQVKSNNEAGAATTLEQLAAQSNSPESWGRLINYTMDHSKPRDIDALNLMRLGVVTNASLSVPDYSLMGSVALRKGYPGDAVTAAKHGGNAPGASAKAAADQRDLAREEASSKSKGGEFNVQLAEDYYGYGRYPEAEEAARRAIAKGGMKNPGEANMVLGMAMVGQGHYSDAIAAFQRVSGGPGATKAAHLWLILAQSKAAPAAASAH
jgi:tetratricopeptide (TPR) repeat protein